MSRDIRSIELGKLEDIIKMIASSMSPPPLHHMKAEDTHIYFIPASLGFGRAVIYFVKTKEEVREKYVVYDTIHDKVSFSDEISTKPSLKHFFIVEVKAQNILHLP